MSNKGYKLENDIENFLLKLAEQSRDLPMWKRCHRVPQSGAIRGEKGDVISVDVPFFDKQLMFECKRRKERLKTGMLFTLPERWLTKNEDEAYSYELRPIFVGAFTSARHWRMFVVTDKKICINFLNFSTGVPVEIIKANKKGNFKIQKKILDKAWDEDYQASFKLEGKRSWMLYSFKIFEEILISKKGEGNG